MELDAIIVCGVIVMAVILFVTEKLSVDLIGLLIIVALGVSGVLTGEEVVKGFSNDATVTVAAMFVISAAIFKTGGVSLIGPQLAKMIRKNYTIGLIAMMLVVAAISAFINNTPVVAVFIPVVIHAANANKHSPSKLLMPLSFAAIMGGTCTMIGTSTNILVSGIAKQSGITEMTMFSFLPLGIIFLVCGIVYMLLVGQHLLPSRNAERNLAEKFGVRDYLSEIVLLPDGKFIGKKLKDTSLIKDIEMDVIELRREGECFTMPSLDMELQANDTLKVLCDVDKIKALKDKIMIQSNPAVMLAGDYSLDTENTTLVELIITANSEFEGKTLNQVDFKSKYRAVALAIKSREEIMHEKLSNVIMKAGDVLLAEVKKDRLVDFRNKEVSKDNPFIILSEDRIYSFDAMKFWLVTSLVAAAVILAALDIVPIMLGAIATTTILVLVKNISMKELYEAIDWKVIFLLAGALSLGVGMEKTGVADMIAKTLVKFLGGYGPIFIVSGLYLLTSLLTEMMSNNATAALLSPVAIVTAKSMEVSPLPFLMCIAFGASASFMTPVGYQTNTMIYTAGEYKFSDFLKVGSLLNLFFWAIATFLIPVFYPF